MLIQNQKTVSIVIAKEKTYEKEKHFSSHEQIRESHWGWVLKRLETLDHLQQLEATQTHQMCDACSI